MTFYTFQLIILNRNLNSHVLRLFKENYNFMMDKKIRLTLIKKKKKIDCCCPHLYEHEPIFVHLNLKLNRV